MPPDVVVVAENAVLVARQEADRVRSLPVLEMQQAVREQSLHRLHELLDQCIDFVIVRRRLAKAEIERIGAKGGIGGADVEQDRRQSVRWHARTGGIELQLSDRDAHAVGADVAEPQNAPASGDANGADIGHRPIAQHLDHAALHVARDIHAKRTPIDMAELEAGLGNGRVIENGDEARRIGHHHVIEEGLVAIV